MVLEFSSNYLKICYLNSKPHVKDEQVPLIDESISKLLPSPASPMYRSADCGPLRVSAAAAGVRPEDRIPVVYERYSDAAGRLLTTVIIVSLLAYALSASRGKSPISMNALVSGTVRQWKN